MTCKLKELQERTNQAAHRIQLAPYRGALIQKDMLHRPGQDRGRCNCFKQSLNVYLWNVIHRLNGHKIKGDHQLITRSNSIKSIRIDSKLTVNQLDQLLSANNQSIGKLPYKTRYSRADRTALVCPNSKLRALEPAMNDVGQPDDQEPRLFRQVKRFEKTF